MRHAELVSWPGFSLVGLMTLLQKGSFPAASRPFLTRLQTRLGYLQLLLNSSHLQSVSTAGSKSVVSSHRTPAHLSSTSHFPSLPASLPSLPCFLLPPNPILPLSSIFKSFSFPSDLNVFFFLDFKKCLGNFCYVWVENKEAQVLGAALPFSQVYHLGQVTWPPVCCVAYMFI